VVWAVSSRSTVAGDASAPSNSVNPYGLADAPVVTGASKPQGERSVSWTWTQPSGNGRPVTGYQYSLDGGAWTNTDARSFSTGAGYSETHTLRVRAISAGQPGRIGSDTSRSGSEPPPPGPRTWAAVVNVNSCLEEARGAGKWDGDCDASTWMPQGSNLQLECFRDGWGSHRWYYIYSKDGKRWTDTNRFIRADTVNGAFGGMGSCPSSY
jgi:hypothetical protein